MRLIILQTPNEVSEWAAKYVRKNIIEFKPGPDRFFVLGLPTGQPFLFSMTFDAEFDYI